MRVTSEFIVECASDAGGWTKYQLSLLGVAWPPPKGWKKGVIGSEIDDAVAAAFRNGPPAGVSSQELFSDSGSRLRLTEVVIYVDGACFPNPGPGGYAAILVYRRRDGPVEREISGSEPVTTNNRMELMGAIAGLEALKWSCRVSVYTDSMYVKMGVSGFANRWIKNGWRTQEGKDVKNRDLWERLLSVDGYHEVEWHHVRGHRGDPLNERADRLAVAARRSIT